MEQRTEFTESLRSHLNDNQKSAFDSCTNGDKSVFCTGGGGTGKTTVLSSVVEYFTKYRPENNKYFAVTASTGMAAFLIGGMTLHRFAGVGIEENDEDVMYQRAIQGMSKDYWTNTEILIIDEISMISCNFFERLSRVASKIRHNSLPFGGIRILMFGDFLQLPPVNPGDDRSQRVFHSDAWKILDPAIIVLKQIVRQTNADYARLLSEIRYGICSVSTTNYIKCLEYEPEYDDGVSPVKLFARRKDVDNYNIMMLQTLETEEYTFDALDIGDKNMLKQCPAPETLTLKIGSQVIVIRNISPTIVNGTIAVVESFAHVKRYNRILPHIRITDPDGTSTVNWVSPVSWESVTPQGKILCKRIQIPLMLAWAVTIHRSQGQTIGRLSIDMNGIFEVGQAYVALSRCPDPSHLSVHNFSASHIMASFSCTQFYSNLDDETRPENTPEYENPPDYATIVAGDTPSEWDSNRAQVDQPDMSQPMVDEATIENQIMLGNLSLADM